MCCGSAPGAPVLLFNGRDGEFSASLDTSSRKAASLVVGAQTRAQEAPPDVDYLFAPLKHARLDYMAQKAVEMGARRLRPVITRHTQVDARQSRASARQRDRGLRTVWNHLGSGDRARRAAWRSAQKLAGRAAPRLLRRGGGSGSPLDALADAAKDGGVGLLIGPEGGFDDDERAAILSAPRVLRLSLGPRILRADTAAVAALTLIQATLGDWPKSRTGDEL